MKLLFLIPARGNSKGIPGKNIKPLFEKPLIHYSLEYARLFAADEDICISTDSHAIAECVRDLSYDVPFTRPAHLATDTAGTYEVVQHAISFYNEQKKNYDVVVLLQPTSPFREKFHLEKALTLFNKNIDMVVSVKESAANPYFNLFEEDQKGFLNVSKGEGSYTRRQDAPKVYEYNGSLYIINIASMHNKKSFAAFDKKIKYVMAEEYSIDIDTMADWKYAEFLHAEKKHAKWKM